MTRNYYKIRNRSAAVPLGYSLIRSRFNAMSYLKEFLKQINQRDFQKFLILWEEYCNDDKVDVEEFCQILQAIKGSELTRPFGQIAETALPLWRTIKNQNDSYKVLRLLVDLQTTNSQELNETVLRVLKQAHENDPKFYEKLRLIGFNKKESFQGVISQYDLVSHFEKGNCVFHTGGWGTGEIVEVSLVREHLTIEFENVGGRKDLSFANAFKTLVPLSKEHFLTRRFIDPDTLEKDAKTDAVSVIKLLLSDLGPKTAAEIKDELCELVIPEEDWTKWWQATRSKIKKDPLIETPDALKEPFKLRKAELTHQERMSKAIGNKTENFEIILNTYNFVRDNPGSMKNPDIKKTLQDKVLAVLKEPGLTQDQLLQIAILLEQFFGYQLEGKSVEALVKQIPNIEAVVNASEIIAFKKQALIAIKDYRSDWIEIFLSMLSSVQLTQLRDYLLKELDQPTSRKQLEQFLRNLIENPTNAPDTFVWYFQKLMSGDKSSIPFHDKVGQCLFFEAFLTLYSRIENHTAHRDLLKKMYTLLSSHRYALIRQIFQGSDLEYIKEFLLLASKCQSLSGHDMKILRSLAEVVYPSLSSDKSKKGKSSSDENIIWTTEAGYFKTQERIKQIGTVEIVENAREIEAARALGDLRENSEYKFALEKRARLQADLKTLSDQLHRARIITKEDITPNEIGIGNIVEINDPQGQRVCYTILGPWDADVDANILSFQSKLAQAMLGFGVGDKFKFRDEEYRVMGIRSYLD